MTFQYHFKKIKSEWVAGKGNHSCADKVMEDSCYVGEKTGVSQHTMLSSNVIFLKTEA